MSDDDVKKKPGRPFGSKNKFSTRMWLDQALKEHSFDAVNEFVKLYRESEQMIKARLTETLWNYLYAKPRSEDIDGNPEDPSPHSPIVVTLDVLKALVDKASEKK